VCYNTGCIHNENPACTYIHHQEGLCAKTSHANGPTQIAGKLSCQISARLYFFQRTVDRREAGTCVFISNKKAKTCDVTCMLISNPCAHANVFAISGPLSHRCITSVIVHSLTFRIFSSYLLGAPAPCIIPTAHEDKGSTVYIGLCFSTIYQSTLRASGVRFPGSTCTINKLQFYL